MTTDNIVVMIAVPSEEVARRIAGALLEQKLAACANLIGPVSSIYTWKGEVHDDQEVLMLVKTRAALFNDEFIQAVKAIHPYGLPEIIALPIQMGSKDYLDWIDEVTR